MWTGLGWQRSQDILAAVSVEKQLTWEACSVHERAFACLSSHAVSRCSKTSVGYRHNDSDGSASSKTGRQHTAPMCEPASLSARPHLFLSQPLLRRCYELNHQYSKSSFQCYEVRHKLNVSARPDPQYLIFALPKEPSREAAQCSAASEQ